MLAGRTGTTGIDEERIVNEVDDVIVHEGGGSTLGTDHAWGSHHFVVGGPVRGGDFYGVAGSNGTVFPTLAANGPDDTDQGSSARGRWIPTTAVDQYGATLASWFGVGNTDLAAVFPNIGRFGQSNLGFLA